jgi:hypothetical protein
MGGGPVSLGFKLDLLEYIVRVGRRGAWRAIRGASADLPTCRHNDLQAAGYCLDPEFWSHKQYENGEVMSGMRATCKKLLSPDKAAQAMTQLMTFLRN